VSLVSSFSISVNYLWTMHNDTSIERNSGHFLFNVFTFCILCHGICVIQVAAYNYIFVSRLIVWRERKRFILHRNLFGRSFTKYCIWFLITIPDIQIIMSDITCFDKYLSGTQTPYIQKQSRVGWESYRRNSIQKILYNKSNKVFKGVQTNSH